VLYTRGTCDDANTDYACTSDASTQYVLKQNVVQDSPLWIIVDGDGGEQGSYQLDVVVTPKVAQ
jgi:hypothetical protein